MIEHRSVTARQARFHVALAGSGPPLLFLHGWPEFWLTWEPVMRRLADRFTCIAPDLRGFGDSEKFAGEPTSWSYGPDQHAQDMLELMTALGHQRFGVVAHDVGGAAAQPLARMDPGRLAGLFLFNFMYPGIGPRLATPDRLNEVWYQSFHQMPFASTLVGASRETCRAYLRHFLTHIAHRKDAFDDVLEDFVDNFLKPGNLDGGFAHYRASHAGRVAVMSGTAPALPPITVPACVRWAAHDFIFPPSFSDRLGETFADLDLAILPGVGHFPHREDPDLAAREIGAFFSRRF
jgi:pimeloyl-ACP methyl ester carboxylesterase